MGDNCDCDDCGGVRNCGCGPETQAPSSSARLLNANRRGSGQVSAPSGPAYTMLQPGQGNGQYSEPLGPAYIQRAYPAYLCAPVGQQPGQGNGQYAEPLGPAYTTQQPGQQPIAMAQGNWPSDLGYSGLKGVPVASKPSGSSCSGGVCSVTSQSTGVSRMKQTPIHRSSARLYRGTGFSDSQRTRLSAYEELSLKVGPQVTSNGPMAVAAVGGYPLPADLNVPYPRYEGDINNPAVFASAQAKPGMELPSTQQPPQQQPPQQQQGMTPEIAQGLMNLGTTGIGALQTIITTAITQGNTTDRARLEMDMRREVARLQSQGLLTQQQATDALGALQNAQAIAPPPFVQPQFGQPGWWESLPPSTRTLITVGGLAGVAGIGYLVYRSSRS